MIEQTSKEESITDISPVQIVVAGAVNTGKSTIAQIVTDALVKNGFHVTLKDDQARMGDKMVSKACESLQEKGCPVKVMTLQLGQAGLNALGNNIEKRQPSSPIIYPGKKS